MKLLGAADVDAEGGVIEAVITAGEDCSWQLKVASDWLRTDATSGSGEATLEILVFENIADQRSTTIQFDDADFSVTQVAGDYPQNYVLIEGGLPRTSSTTVTVDVSTVYGDRASAICVSTTTSCTNWLPWSPQVTARLPTSPGEHTVSVWVLVPDVAPSALRMTDSIERSM